MPLRASSRRNASATSLSMHRLTPLVGSLGEYLDRGGPDGHAAAGRGRHAPLGRDVRAQQLGRRPLSHSTLVIVMTGAPATRSRGRASLLDRRRRRAARRARACADPRRISASTRPRPARTSRSARRHAHHTADRRSRTPQPAARRRRRRSRRGSSSSRPRTATARPRPSRSAPPTRWRRRSTCPDLCARLAARIRDRQAPFAHAVRGSCPGQPSRPGRGGAARRCSPTRSPWRWCAGWAAPSRWRTAPSWSPAPGEDDGRVIADLGRRAARAVARFDLARYPEIAEAIRSRRRARPARHARRARRRAPTTVLPVVVDDEVSGVLLLRGHDSTPALSATQLGLAASLAEAAARALDGRPRPERRPPASSTPRARPPAAGGARAGAALFARLQPRPARRGAAARRRIPPTSRHVSGRRREAPGSAGASSGCPISCRATATTSSPSSCPRPARTARAAVGARGCGSVSRDERGNRRVPPSGRHRAGRPLRAGRGRAAAAAGRRAASASAWRIEPTVQRSSGATSRA